MRKGCLRAAGNSSARILRRFVFRNFVSSTAAVERLSRDILTPSTSRPFPSSTYITYTISVYRSWLILVGSLPQHEVIHHTTFFIKLIFFKKSHLRYLERLLSLATRKSARGERKIHLALEDKMDMKIFMLKVIYVRASRHRYDSTRILS